VTELLLEGFGHLIERLVAAEVHVLDRDLLHFHRSTSFRRDARPHLEVKATDGKCRRDGYNGQGRSLFVPHKSAPATFARITRE
jgi:hypothetical protein